MGDNSVTQSYFLTVAGEHAERYPATGLIGAEKTRSTGDGDDQSQDRS